MGAETGTRVNDKCLNIHPAKHLLHTHRPSKQLKPDSSSIHPSITLLQFHKEEKEKRTVHLITARGFLSDDSENSDNGE